MTEKEDNEEEPMTKFDQIDNSARAVLQVHDLLQRAKSKRDQFLSVTAELETALDRVAWLMEVHGVTEWEGLNGPDGIPNGHGRIVMLEDGDIEIGVVYPERRWFSTNASWLLRRWRGTPTEEDARREKAMDDPPALPGDAELVVTAARRPG